MHRSGSIFGLIGLENARFGAEVGTGMADYLKHSWLNAVTNALTVTMSIQ